MNKFYHLIRFILNKEGKLYIINIFRINIRMEREYGKEDICDIGTT